MTSKGSATGKRTLWLCTAAALLEGFDNQTMGVAAPRLIAEFHLTAAQSGIIFSSATIGLFFGALIGGRGADHRGRKRALTVSLLLFGVCSLLTAAASTIEWLFAARLLTGIGLGGAMPNFISLASESTHAERRVSSVTLVMAGMPFGGALAGLMALGAQWGWGWRSIFIAGGLMPILLSILTGFLLQERRAPASSQTMVASRVEPVPAALFGSGRGWTTVLLWASFFFTQLVLLLMLNWLPSLIVGLGYTRTQASWASICFNLSGSAGAAVLGLLHAGTRRRLWVVVTYVGMATALAAVASVGTNFPLIAIACSGAGMFIVGAQLTLFSLAPPYYHGGIRGTGVGAAVAAGRLGSIVGPLFAGGLLAGGGGSAAVLMAIVPFVAVGGGAAFALTWRRQTVD